MFGRKKRNKPKKKRSIAKKILRFFLFTFLSLIGLIILAAIIIPVFFKDEIEAAIKSELRAQLDVEPSFDIDDFSLTIFSHFPDVTAQMDNFGLIGKGDFKGDTLVHAGSFKVDINLWSLLGDNYKINGIYLDKPVINALITKDGKANFDIVKAGDTTKVEESTDTAATKFAFSITEWRITDARVKYDDKQGNTFAEIKGLTHGGTGDFTQDVFDLSTDTKIKDLTVSYDGTKYFSNDSLEIDFTINISEEMSRYKFKDNNFALNLFKFGMDGQIDLLDKGEIKFTDFKFFAKETEFKNILSLVPEAYLPDFNELKTSGTLAFDGKVNGSLIGEKIPTFDINLAVKEGMFQYPKLPAGVSAINIDLALNNPDGNLENTLIDLKNFSANLGKSDKVAANAKIKGMTNVDIDSKVDLNMNLANVKQYYKTPEIEKLAGALSITSVVKGVYNDKGSIPAVNVYTDLKNGLIKTPYFEKAIEKINLNSRLDIPSSNLSAGKFALNNFNIELDGEPFGAKGTVTDFDAINYDFLVNGTANLDKWMKLYPIEGMDLGGKIHISELKLKGDLNTILEENYGALENSGDIDIENFNYFDKAYLPGPITIAEATSTFTPKDIKLKSCSGKISKSDYSASGTIENYMGYTFYIMGYPSNDSIIKGHMKYASKVFDVDEWMYEDGTPPTDAEVAAAAAAEEEPLVVYPLPRNIDFVLNSSIDKVKYDNYDMSNLKGDIIFRDGKIDLVNGIFNLFGGQFRGGGSYDTRDAESPGFAFDLDVKNLGISEAYNAFTVVQKFVPAAEKVTGKINTNFTMDGKLAKDYMPITKSLSMDGVFKVLDATAKDSKLMKAINGVTSLNEPSDIKINNTTIKAKIEDGYLSFQPFKMNAGNLDMDIEGKNGLDGGIDYKIGMDVPSKLISQGVNNSLAKVGLPAAAGNKMAMNLGVGGTYDKPKVKILGVDGMEATNVKEAVKDSVKEVITEKVDAIKQHYIDDAQKQIDKMNSKTAKTADSLRALGDKAEIKSIEVANKLAQEARDNAKKAADKQLKEAKTPLAKIAAKKTAEKTIAEGDKKAAKIEEEGKVKGANQKQTFYDKADKLEAENKKKTETIMTEAKKKAGVSDE